MEAQDKITIVSGPSGSGKSSLLISALVKEFGIPVEQFEDVEDYVLENEYLGDL